MRKLNFKPIDWFVVCALTATLMITIGVLASEELTPTATGVVLCNPSPTAGADIDMGGCKSSMMIPLGSTADRPSSPLMGMVRANSDLGTIEFYTNQWVPFLPRSFTNNANHALVITAAAANGYQLSSSRDSQVSYSASITTTATIGGAGTGYIVLEICSTNSTTAGNWIEISRIANSQTITLAIVLNSVQAITGVLQGVVPAGYYVRERSVVSAGTVSFGANATGQEVLL